MKENIYLMNSLFVAFFKINNPIKIIEKLKIDIQLHNDSYQYERAERLGVCKSSIGYNLKKLNITYKKNSNTSKSRRREARIIQRKNQEA